MSRESALVVSSELEILSDTGENYCHGNRYASEFTCNNVSYSYTRHYIYLTTTEDLCTEKITKLYVKQLSILSRGIIMLLMIPCRNEFVGCETTWPITNYDNVTNSRDRFGMVVDLLSLVRISMGFLYLSLKNSRFYLIFPRNLLIIYCGIILLKFLRTIII